MLTRLTRRTRPSTHRSDRSGALVWIDSESASVIRWADHQPKVERYESDVPAHHKGTRHVRYDPVTRHGGGGSWQAGEERHRIEHLDRFVAEIADRLSQDEDLVIVGPGTVHERLAALLRDRDARSGRSRLIDVRTSEPRTRRQLVAQLRAHLGATPRRRGLEA
jgi:hypothetical protein